MTSMLLMLSAVLMLAPVPTEKWRAGGSAPPGFFCLPGRGISLFFAVPAGRSLEQGVNQVLVALYPIRHQHPLAAIPLLDFDLARTLMVLAGSLDLRQQPGRAQLLQTGIGDVQIFQAPTHMFATHDLALAELALRRAHRLYRRQGA